jgi:hypothetical protein
MDLNECELYSSGSGLCPLAGFDVSMHSCYLEPRLGGG